MSVLVTGGAGYIGSITVELLHERGTEVVVIDNLGRGHRNAVVPQVKLYEGSIGDAALIKTICAKHKVDSCIHFAALAYVGESVTDPRRYFDNNVSQALSLLGALLDSGVRQFVFSSTCATYGEPEHIPIDEDHQQRPVNPYGWSKLIVERALAGYDLAYGMKFIALRYFNAAGATALHGEDHNPETHLIPIVIDAALGKTQSVPVYGNDYPTPDGTAIRDYIHVTDLGRAHLLALDYLKAGGDSQYLNLGTGTGYSVMEVIDTVRRISGKPVTIEIQPRRAGDPSELVARASRATDVLGWKPQDSSLDNIVETAWRWHSREKTQ